MTTRVSAHLANTLYQFSPVGLQEVTEASLMNRQETKYLLPVGVLPDLLTRLKDEYQVLTIDDHQLLPYRTLYLDTPEFDLYYAHHNGRARRYKIRFRSYDQTQTTFLEVKERRANGRTIKTRTAVTSSQLPLNPASVALLDQVPTYDQAFEPKLWVNYHRITLVGIDRPERVTLDFGLEFLRPDDQHALQVEHVVVVELKLASLRQASPFRSAARQQGYREGGLSKYGLGCSFLHPVKHNTFKPQSLAVKRLQQLA